MSKTAREIMTGHAECIGESETIVTAAEKLARDELRRAISRAR